MDWLAKPDRWTWEEEDRDGDDDGDNTITYRGSDIWEARNS